MHITCVLKSFFIARIRKGLESAKEEANKPKFAATDNGKAEGQRMLKNHKRAKMFGKGRLSKAVIDNVMEMTEKLEAEAVSIQSIIATLKINLSNIIKLDESIKKTIAAKG